jgi:hypothetical protein
MCDRGEGVDIDPEQMREAMAPRWDFIRGLDMAKHKEEALAVMESLSS